MCSDYISLIWWWYKLHFYVHKFLWSGGIDSVLHCSVHSTDCHTPSRDQLSNLDSQFKITKPILFWCPWDKSKNSYWSENHVLATKACVLGDATLYNNLHTLTEKSTSLSVMHSGSTLCKFQETQICMVNICKRFILFHMNHRM